MTRAHSNHLDEKGRPRMVDVSAKDKTLRTALAESVVRLSPRTAASLRRARDKKGDPLPVAILAGIQAAKRTSDLIPLCHPLPLESVCVEPVWKQNAVVFRVTCVTHDRTGVEMEAMTGAAVAALAFYDMVKSIDKGIVIGPVRLLEKSGGKSGLWKRQPAARRKGQSAKRFW